MIAGLAAALSIAVKMREKEAVRLLKIRDYLIREIEKIFPRASVNGSVTQRLPNNLNILLPGVNAEFLVLKLDAAGFAISTKSACVIGEESSYVLKAIGRSEAEAKSSLRISLGRRTQIDDARRFVKELGKILSEGHILV